MSTHRFRWRFVHVRVRREPRNLWVGLFWARRVDLNAREALLDLCVCFVPVVSIYVRFRRLKPKKKRGRDAAAGAE